MLLITQSSDLARKSSASHFPLYNLKYRTETSDEVPRSNIVNGITQGFFREYLGG